MELQFNKWLVVLKMEWVTWILVHSSELSGNLLPQDEQPVFFKLWAISRAPNVTTFILEFKNIIKATEYTVSQV